MLPKGDPPDGAGMMKACGEPPGELRSPASRPVMAGHSQNASTPTNSRGNHALAAMRLASPRSTYPELFCQGVGVTGEQADVGADPHELVAPVDVAADFLFVAAQDAGRLADRLEPRDRVLHRRLRFRVLRVAEMAERSGQIGGPDEDAVDAVDLGDGFQLVERATRLDLHQHAHLAVG